MTKLHFRVRGAASLAVVLVLFFILAMVAAYTNRNLIFEQRTSANSYRSARALAAADAGVDWVTAMLNGARVSDACIPSAGGTDDFKTRYLRAMPDGRFEPVLWDRGTFPTGAATTPGMKIQTQPACSAIENGGWGCSCPSGPTAQLDPSRNNTPAFVVAFKRQGPGVVGLQVRGCSNVRSGEVDSSNINNYKSCHINDINATNMSVKADLLVDATAIIRTSLGLVKALPVAPTAAMTVVGNITQASGSLSAANPDAATGIALRAGGNIAAAPAVNAAGVAGSSANPKVPSDPELGGMGGADFFRLALGLPEANYQQQPAVVNCASPCSSLATLAADNPTRVIFVAGNAALSSGTVGTASAPAMLVATGDVNISGSVNFTGVIFAGRNLNWSATGGSVSGAVIVGNDYSGSGTASITYNRDAVRQVHLSYGSFVRIPGSWNTEH